MNLGTILTETAARDPGHAAVSVERLGREISPSGYPVGDTFTVADLTVAALRYPVAREFPYPMIADGDLPDSWREFVDSLAHRPGGRWVAAIYRRHRGRSAELMPGEAATLRPDPGLEASTP